MKHATFAGVVSSLVLGAAAGLSWGQCEPEWSDRFEPTSFRGSVSDGVIFDDGARAQLVVGGGFRLPFDPPATTLRRWDGSEWSDFGSFEVTGPHDSNFMLLQAVNDADPPRLLATRYQLFERESVEVFIYEDGVWATNGFDVDSARVAGLLRGPAAAPQEIYLWGDIVLADEGGASRVVRWDGSRWAPLGDFDSVPVRNLVWFDDGSGEALYISVWGEIDGVQINGVGRWDGQSWSEVGGGCPASRPRLAVHDDGSGPALWGIGDDLLVKWDGQSWTSFDLPPEERVVSSLVSADIGDGAQLLWSQSGSGIASLWRWTGSEAEQIGGLTGRSINTLVYDPTDAAGGGIVIGGSFRDLNGLPASNIGGYGPNGWRAIGSEEVGNGAEASRRLLWVGREGGPLLRDRLFVTTTFAGGRWARGVATWDGSSWEAIGSAERTIYAGPLAFGDIGAGPSVFTWSQYGLVAWDGRAWTALASAESINALALAVGSVADGPPRVYIGGTRGRFDDGTSFNSVAAVDLQGWHDLGGGLPTDSGRSEVHALTLHDDGSGSQLYAGGRFYEVDPSLDGAVVRWDGDAWSRVGAEIFQFGDVVFSLCVADLGEGPRLFAGGYLDGVGGDLGNVIEWDGTSWSRVGTGLPTVATLERVVIDGQPRLAAAVWAISDNGPEEKVYLWNGDAWHPLGARTDGTVRSIAQAPADANAIYLSGDFDVVADTPSEGIARFGCACPPDFNADGTLDTRDVIAFLNAWAAGDEGADFNGDGVVDTADVLDFLAAWAAGCD